MEHLVSLTRKGNMTPEEFDAALKKLGWKQADFCRITEVDKNTPSRWMNKITPIPGWARSYLGMALKIKELSVLIDAPRGAS